MANITTDDALLLAYVAGELEGEAFLQLESRLQTDSALRQRATDLRADYQQTMRAVASLDGSYHIDDRRSLLRIDGLMQQWETQTAQISAPIPLHRWRPPRWSYAAAAAIALLIGFCFWWANNTPTTQLAQIPTSDPAPEVAVDTPNHPIPAAPTNANPDPGPVQMPLAFQDVSSENSDRLASLEKDVVALSNDQLLANNTPGDTNQ